LGQRAHRSFRLSQDQSQKTSGSFGTLRWSLGGVLVGDEVAITLDVQFIKA